MKNKFDLELLSFICEALQKPIPRREHGLYAYVVSNVIREGWVSFADIEDVICETDPRLYGLELKGLAEALEIPTRMFFPRPSAGEKEAYGYSGFELPDAAALLISLRRLGFSVDPQPLVDLVLPQLKTKPTFNDAELSVYWFRKNRDRFSGLTVQADDERPQALRIIDLVTENGNRVEICLNQHERPWLLTVLPPQRPKARGVKSTEDQA